MSHPTMTGGVASPVLPGDADGIRLVAWFGSLPFRRLAGPAGVFFLWPPKSRARTGASPVGQP